MRKFILWFSGTLIVLSMIFIIGNEFYTGIKKSIQNNETYRIYKENTDFYISGQVFKVDVPENFGHYCILYVKTDSVNISKTFKESDRVLGIYDEKNKIAVLLSRASSRNWVVDKDIPSNQLPYIVYKSDPKEKSSFVFTFSNENLRLSETMTPKKIKEKLGRALMERMDTMQNPIKF